MIRLGLLTDLHWAVDPPAGEAWNNPYDFAGLAERVGRAGRALHREGAEAIVVLGDLSHRGDAESMRQALNAVTCPSVLKVWAIPGNHDRAGEEHAFEEVAGERRLRSAPPLVGLDVRTGSGWKDGRIGELPRLPGGSPLVVASHYPLISVDALLTGAGFRYSEDALDRAEALAAIEGRPAVVLSGHVHARVSASEGTVLQLIQPALVEPPYECALVEIDATTVRRRSIDVGPTAAERLPVFCHADETWDYDAGAWRLTRPPSPAAPPAVPATRSPAGESAPA